MLKSWVKLPLLFSFLVVAISAQSTNQDAPTLVTSDQIVGVIKPRRIGDNRLTRYFYVFSANQGDLFINVRAQNFDGDIDLFISENLRPLAKITIYSADTTIETSRVVYLRKSERLLLRVEGRTPNDSPAQFYIKFAGSFIVLAAPTEELQTPKLFSEEQGIAKLGELRVEERSEVSLGKTVDRKENGEEKNEWESSKVEKVARESKGHVQKTEKKEESSEELSGEEEAQKLDRSQQKSLYQQEYLGHEEAKLEKSNRGEAKQKEIGQEREQEYVEGNEYRQNADRHSEVEVEESKRDELRSEEQKLGEFVSESEQTEFEQVSELKHEKSGETEGKRESKSGSKEIAELSLKELLESKRRTDKFRDQESNKFKSKDSKELKVEKLDERETGELVESKHEADELKKEDLGDMAHEETNEKELEESRRKKLGETNQNKSHEINSRESKVAGMCLIVTFRNGKKYEKSMEEILTFRMDEETLVVLSKDGKVERFRTEEILGISVERKN